ncbi:MAG: YggS family pyridoxal phosphate-dependent enzyme [Lysobacterales bacterium]
MTFDTPLQPLISVKKRIAEAAVAAGRNPHDITLLAVSKRHPAQAVEKLVSEGQRHFGENYVSEALEKMAALSVPALHWHFIGPIQSNKTRDIAHNFSWVHSVDRSKILLRLNDARPASAPPLNCCLQINIEGEASKSGASVQQAEELVNLASQLPRLHLRGLMCIPAPSTDRAQQEAVFARLRQLRDSLRRPELPLEVLSMGMSGDLEAAITQGSTIVRIGTALFGPRSDRPSKT